MEGTSVIYFSECLASKLSFLRESLFLNVHYSSLYYNEYLIWTLSFLLAVVNLCISSSIAFAQLSWNVLPTVSIDRYVCMKLVLQFLVIVDSVLKLLLPYHNYINITNRKIGVNGILKATCYVFGVRRYLLLNTCKYAVLFVFKADIVIKWYTDLCNNTKRN